MTEDIILVDEKDNQVGVGEKLDTYKKDLLYRASSILGLGVWHGLSVAKT